LRVFVIEQNRDGQLRTMLMTENGISPRKLQSILNFDGLPITADFITEKIQALLADEHLENLQVSQGGKA
jgi:2-oxoglutarate ferredoxin oxidoreductase subunit alpha